MPHTPVIVPAYQMDLFDKKIEAFYRSNAGLSGVDKMLAAASLFLDCPYLFEPLGEGPDAPYDQFPLYRTDLFDCVTYMNTILALTHSDSLHDFKHNLMRVRYTDASVRYASRTDWFPDLDWLPNTRKLGWIQDTTANIVDDSQQSIAMTGETIIDKPNWFQVKTLRSLHHLAPLSPTTAETLLQQLREEGRAFQAQQNSINYIPTERLLDKNYAPRKNLFDQMPAAAVVVFAKPNWEIRDHFKDFPQGYGSNLNVRHVGLAFQIGGQVMLYHASFNSNNVMCMPLAEYLAFGQKSEVFAGIHLEEIMF